LFETFSGYHIDIKCFAYREAALESQLKASSKAAKSGEISKTDTSSVVSGTIFTRFENMEDVQAVIDNYEDINAVQPSQPEKDDDEEDDAVLMHIS